MQFSNLLRELKLKVCVKLYVTVRWRELINNFQNLQKFSRKVLPENAGDNASAKFKKNLSKGELYGNDRFLKESLKTNRRVLRELVLHTLAKTRASTM